jgi:hypothetical protein
MLIESDLVLLRIRLNRLKGLVLNEDTFETVLIEDDELLVLIDAAVAAVVIGNDEYEES